MSVSFSHFSPPFSETSIAPSISLFPVIFKAPSIFNEKLEQVILSEGLNILMIMGSFVTLFSHMLQKLALPAMKPPIGLDGEDIRNEKVKVLRSIRKLEPSDVILGQYKATSRDKLDVRLSSRTPTFFATALYIDNARWDGVPFIIKGEGAVKACEEFK